MATFPRKLRKTVARLEQALAARGVALEREESTVAHSWPKRPSGRPLWEWVVARLAP